MPSEKTVLITGASTGIGRVTAEFFAAKGWNVAATMRSPEKSDLASKSDRIKLFKLDVTDQVSVDRAVQDVIGHFGGIDVLVNNAGYGLLGPFEAQTDEQIRRQFETNVFGVMNVTRAVLPHMRERKQGRIVNVGSAAGRLTLPLYSMYCATKWALEGFSESLWFELRQHNIKVKIIEPGMIKTDFFERSREVATKEGLTAYDEFVSLVMPNLKAWEDAGAEPVVVARSIWRASTSFWPRLRYQPNATLSVWARGWVPGHLSVRLVRRLFNAW
ncbi:SDR family oxidoreductase [Hyphomicrobium sp. CS1GBMeth3]|uniref:SDR family oxidoreductase n=1 Tax=Hyphomicrobium sp. CS1GBMeth3 TaxID=1892845 RepID=UPI00093199AA|nr:SDR family oxidoreductase [Hyphomicrobium sp. CS1GBMeth3]